MKVNCKACGKLHTIDTRNLSGSKVKFKCTACQEYTFVGIPRAQALETVSATRVDAQPAGRKLRHRLSGMGLRPKMVFLFVVIPVSLVAASGLIHLNQMDSLSSALTRESSDLIESIAKEIIADKARTVAKQCETYLRKNPRLTREQFAADADFASIAVQKVGSTGYTALYAVPDPSGTSRTWVHPNPKIVGIDLLDALRKPLGERYDDFVKIYAGAYQGQEAMGYYLWKDTDGQYREKFMVSTPVKGTPYIIASTTYIDEFTSDIKYLKIHAGQIASRSRNTALQVLAGTILILAIIVAMFSTSLSKRLRSLTHLAERISYGELDVQVEDHAKDEIGKLASAIERMRASISISISRLRDRRRVSA